jgi:hypothetical protein
MSEPTFSHIHDGSLVAADTTIRISAGTLTKGYGVVNKTGSGDGQAARFDVTRWYHRLSIEGWLYVSSKFHKAIRTNAVSDPATGLQIERISRATIVRDLQLQDATAAPDPNGVAYWIPGVKTFYGSAGGYGQEDETPLEESSSNAGLVANLSLYVGATALTGPAVLDSVQPNANFRQGGGVWYGFRFRYSTLPSSIPAIFTDSFGVTLKLDNGRQLTGTVKPERIQVDLNWQGGSNIPVRMSGPFHGSVAWADQA